jgi:hypothetical protein
MVRDCLWVSPAIHPLCNAQNSWSLIIDEIRRGCGLLEVRIGHAYAGLFRARDVVRLALERLKRDPLLFLHGPETGCLECDEARRSTTIR